MLTLSVLGDEAAPAAPATQPKQGEPVLGTDVNCDAATNVCTPVSEVAKLQIISLQGALNRAMTFFKIVTPPIEPDGVIGPATLTAAIKIANVVGADAHPIFAEIAAIDPVNKASVRALAERLATAPITIQKAFDDVTGTAREAAAQQQAASAKRTRLYWYIFSAVLLAGLAGGTVYYVRRRQLAPT